MVLRLPGAPVWSAVFFTMLVVLGIDSEFCIVEALVAGLADQWPILKVHRKKFTAAVCGLMFLLGLPMVTHVSTPCFLQRVLLNLRPLRKFS